MKRLLLASVLTLLWVGGAMGFGKIHSGLEKQSPQQLLLYIFPLSEPDRKLGFSEGYLKMHVMARLKPYSIELEAPEHRTPFFVYVRLTTMRASFYHVEVGVVRGVMYIEMDMSFDTLATVWTESGLGVLNPEATAERSRTYIMDHLNMLLDMFLSEYIEVNKSRMRYDTQ